MLAFIPGPLSNRLDCLMEQVVPEELDALLDTGRLPWLSAECRRLTGVESVSASRDRVRRKSGMDACKVKVTCSHGRCEESAPIHLHGGLAARPAHAVVQLLSVRDIASMTPLTATENLSVRSLLATKQVLPRSVTGRDGAAASSCKAHTARVRQQAKR